MPYNEELSAAADSLNRRTDLTMGIPTDSLKVFNGTIGRNTFLADLLLSYGVSYNDMITAIENSTDVLDVRKIVAGSSYAVYCDTTTSDIKAKYFVYHQDALTSYVFSFNDSLNITKHTKEVSSAIRYVSGTIESSLWNAMAGNNIDPMLAVELSEIFAWTVDFFGLQKGDTFKAIYEDRFIDSVHLGIGQIYAAEYSWVGQKYTAIPFLQDSTEGYFDLDGVSLRRAFLKAPLEFTRISSRYSSGRLHPVLRVVRPHYGVDYAAPAGTPVVAVGDGRVTSASYDSSNGNIVRITHNSVYSTAYLHLRGFGPGIRSGVTVKQGQVIGYVGSTGLSTGPHLDFRFYVNGSPVDPLTVESPPVDPIHEENLATFEKYRDAMSQLLSTIEFAAESEEENEKGEY